MTSNYQLTTSISIRGAKGTSKSSLAASLPGGKGWLDLEKGALRALARIPDWQANNTLWNPIEDMKITDPNNAIMSAMMHVRGGLVKGQMDQFESVIKRYSKWLVDPNIHWIIFDTWKEFWEMNHRSHLELAQQKDSNRQEIIPIEYATPNMRMKSVIKAAAMYGKNICLISHERSVFIKVLNEVTGKYDSIETEEKELDGFTGTLGIVDWGFRTSFIAKCTIPDHKDTVNKDKPCKGWHFQVEIEKSGLGQEHVGKTLLDPDYIKLAKALPLTEARVLNIAAD